MKLSPSQLLFWAEVEIFVLLDTLALVKDTKLHPCAFQKSTLFDIRRIAIMVAIHSGGIHAT